MSQDYLLTVFDFNDPAFVSIIDDMPLWSAPFGLKLLDTVHYKKNIRVLDIGFGFGFPLVELAMRLGPTSKVFGIDPSKAGIIRSKLKLRYTGVQNVELIEGVAEQMPFENNFFDLIISNNGLNNVQDLTAVLKECNRVARAGAQFVFTFNTDQTFIEFYNVFREVLRKNGMKEYETKIDEHIYDKRKPLSEYKNLLKESGFSINAVYEDEFCYKFSDGTSMLNHFSTKFFVNVWKELVPEDMQSKIFQEIENKINLLSETSQGFSMGVPFITIDCEKVKG